MNFFKVKILLNFFGGKSVLVICLSLNTNIFLFHISEISLLLVGIHLIKINA